MLINPEAAKYIFRQYSQESYHIYGPQPLPPSLKCCKYNSLKQLDNVALDIKMFREGILTSVVKYVALGLFHFRQIWLQRKQ